MLQFIRVAIITFTMCYFFGMISYIMFDITHIYNIEDTEHNNVFKEYGLHDKGNLEKGFILIYWVCTTFTTVGFGDIYP